MRAREAALHSDRFGDDLERCLPLIPEGSSDSAAFDRVLELLVLAGRPLAPGDDDDDPRRLRGTATTCRAELDDFYRYSSAVVEPWDGPAAMVFSDGRVLGACLDRNGLRPGRWLVTDEGWSCSAPRPGVLPVDPSEGRPPRPPAPRPAVRRRPRAPACCRPTARPSSRSPGRRPYRRWCDAGRDPARATSTDARPDAQPTEPLRTRQLAFGYSQEDLRVLISPARRGGIEPTGSMGNDLALAALSEREPSLFSYFKQRFAQVTNPPIDSVRESIVMSLETADRLRGQPALRGPRARRSSSCSSTRCSPTTSSSGSPARRIRRCGRRPSTRPGRSAPATTGPRGRARADLRARPTAAIAGRHQPDRRLSDRGARPRPGTDPGAAGARRRPPAPGRARAPACRPASWSSPASRARSTTSPR